MPVNILIGIVALIVALVLYSVGSWAAFRAKAFSAKQVRLIWIGFVFDVIATAMMAIQAKGLDLEPLSDLIHTVLAFAAMFGMLAIAILGSRALKAADEVALKALSRWTLAPWALWTGVFLWGMAARGSQRMG